MKFYDPGQRLLIVLITVHMHFVMAAAQEPAGPTKADQANGASRSDQPAPATGRVQVVEPETHYLKDDHGELVPVLDFPYEEFQRLYKLDKQLGQPVQPPPYSLPRLQVTGRVEGDRATLQIRASLKTHREHWIPISWGLHRAVLLDSVTYQGPGEHFAHVDTSQGYVSWIRGPEGSEHSLTLNVLTPVQQIGGEARLVMSLPRATSSTMKLNVPNSALEVSVQGGRLLSSVPHPDGGTEVTVAGIEGRLKLSWRRGGERMVQPASVVEVTGSQLARITGPGTIRTEARLRIRSYGGAAESILVRLPPGAVLVPSAEPGYTVSLLDVVEPPQGNETARQTVEIKIEEPSIRPLDVRLTVERVLDKPQENQHVEVSGFEVVGAARQTGHIALAVSGDSYPDWLARANVRRVNELPKSLEQEAVVACFEYFRQPCSLLVKILPRRSRVSVEPSYLLTVQTDQVRLDAQLKYTIRGAHADFLNIDLRGWDVEEVGPEHLVSKDLVIDAVTPLIIPLRQPIAGSTEVVIRAVRKIDPALGQFSVILPRPATSTLRPATVVVIPDEEVVLVPRDDDIQGLIVDPYPPQIDLPLRGREPFYFRDRGTGPRSVFAADFDVRARPITVEVSSVASLQPDRVGVRQRLVYHLQQEEVDRVVLDVPLSLDVIESLDVHLGEQRLKVAPEEDGDELSEGQPVRMIAKLPEVQREKCELTLSYHLPWEALETGQRVVRRIPLIMPYQVEVTGNALRLESPRTMELIPRDSNWSSAANGVEPEADVHSLNLVAAGLVTEAQLICSLRLLDQDGATVIDQAWLQTWLAHGSRRDRATMYFSSRDQRIRVNLPQGVHPDDVHIRLNGVAASVRPGADSVRREIVIELREGGGRQLLEMWYGFRESVKTAGALTIGMPQIVGANWTRHSYWQLILPGGQHLVRDPKRMTAENHWGWKGIVFGRRPNLTTDQLESWMHASWKSAVAQQPSMNATNQYLFSTLDGVSVVQVQTASRRIILLAVSGSVLVVGLLLVYVPACRHPAALLVPSAVLLSAALVYPEPALLMAQVVGLGLVLVLVAGFVHWSLLRRHGNGGVIHGSSASSFERYSTQLYDMRSDSSLPATAVATAAASVESGGDVESP